MYKLTDRKNEMNDYKVEGSNVYEYSQSHEAYFFIGKLNGRTLIQFVQDIAEFY